MSAKHSVPFATEPSCDEHNISIQIQMAARRWLLDSSMMISSFLCTCVSRSLDSKVSCAGNKGVLKKADADA